MKIIYCNYSSYIQMGIEQPSGKPEIEYIHCKGDVNIITFHLSSPNVGILVDFASIFNVKEGSNVSDEALEGLEEGLRKLPTSIKTISWLEYDSIEIDQTVHIKIINILKAVYKGTDIHVLLVFDDRKSQFTLTREIVSDKNDSYFLELKTSYLNFKSTFEDELVDPSPWRNIDE